MTWIARRVADLLIVVEIVWHRAEWERYPRRPGIADRTGRGPDEACAARVLDWAEP